MTRGRSTDYTKEELLHFLNIALSIKPISQEAWEMVLAEHNVEFGHKNRTVESLRRKYAQLHRKKIPTGDPECPEEVKLAKRVKYAICTAADIGDGVEHMNIFDGGLSGTVSGDGNEDFETDDDGNVDIEVPNDNSSNANGSIGTAVTGNGSGGSVNDNSSAAVTTVAPRLVTTDASFHTVSIGNGGSVDCATPFTNQSTGRSRLVVTPRNRSPSDNIGGAFQDFLQLHVVQMQQDRELQMMRMEDDRRNRQQWMDLMVGALGIFARNNQGGINNEHSDATINDTNTQQSSNS
jgi:hypothetical protein